KGACDGEEATDNPFALSCGEDNAVAQENFCTEYGDDEKCFQTHTGTCSVRPFGTEVPDYKDNEVNCLTHGNGVTYRSQRQLLCAVGAQAATAERCDTDTIAPVVCGTSDGPNSNPFAAFCANSANDGLNNDAARRLAVRQATLTHCLIEANAGVGVCAATSAGDIIKDLETDCKVGETSVTSRCTYTQYEDTQETYCTGANSVTVFDPNCEETTHGEVLAARRTECRKTGSALFKNVEACGTIVSDFCAERDINVLVDKTSGGGYLCEDKSGTAYADMRERVCGVSGNGGGGFAAVCKRTLELICIDAELIGTEVGEGRYNCRTSDVPTIISARQNYCAINDGELGCAPTLTALCTGASLVQTASNGYVCSDSIIDTVLTERRRFCATDVSGT
ncbi:MAG: hypothetical protein K8953_05635, partial [Proteobacteria bacterium]|nr:hypothetical protein [Pseudomonadota bacterium]